VKSSSTAVDLTTGAEYIFTVQFLDWAPSVSLHVIQVQDRNHIIVDRIGGSPRRVRVTNVVQRQFIDLTTFCKDSKEFLYTQ
jgi:hypothetical protein